MMNQASIVERFAERHPWLVRGTLVVACGAMLATSAPPTYSTEFEGAVGGHRAELTAEAPSATFVVLLRAIDLGPGGKLTTLSPSARLVGTIDRALAADGSSASVDVAAGSERMRVFTSFDMTQPLSFSGNCSAPPDDPPCQARLVVEFTREDGGMEGGTIAVDWSLDLASSAPRQESEPAGPFPLPWSTEITP